MELDLLLPPAVVYITKQFITKKEKVNFYA